MQADLQEIKSLLSREIELCKRLRTMVSREIEAIVLKGDMEELLNILQKKDGLIEKLQLVADSWEDIFALTEMQGQDNLKEYFLSLYPHDKELKRLLEEARELSHDILQAEETARVELEKFRDDVHDQLATMSRGQQAAVNYLKMGGGLLY